MKPHFKFVTILNPEEINRIQWTNDIHAILCSYIDAWQNFTLQVFLSVNDRNAVSNLHKI